MGFPAHELMHKYGLEPKNRSVRAADEAEL